VRAGNLEQAIAAYAEHDRIRAFEARDDRDRALVSDWWQAHEARERPVIYAHRRTQVDQLNAVCQRLRAEAGQLGPERLVVGGRSFAVGDVVVLGANARGRLGVVNGTTAVIQDLDLRGRAMTVQTLEESRPRRCGCPAGTWMLLSGPGSRAGSIWPMPAPTCAPRAAPNSGPCSLWTGPRTCRAAMCSSPAASSGPTCT
jgi:hypothetical protein